MTVATSVVSTCAQCRDKWTWVATYTDGTQLRECEGDNTIEHHGYTEIDLSRVMSLAWEPVLADLKPVTVTLSPGSTSIPILFRRRYIEIQVTEIVGPAHPPVHGIGWERDDGQGHIVGSYILVRDDGSIVASDNKNVI